MKLDGLSLLGLSIGLLALLGGNALEGGAIGALANGPALMIVLGGTLGAILLQTPVPVFVRAVKMLPLVFVVPSLDRLQAIHRVVDWCHVARREGLLGLERVAEGERDLFVRKGMQLLVDGHDSESIRRILEMDLDNMEDRDLQAARVFEGMGGYSPTIGIIGAVMGLIHVLQHLEDPGALGPGIATAFVATIYGVALANLLFLPMANKLKARVLNETAYRVMLVEGIISVAEGDNPRFVENKLLGFVT